MLTGGEETRRDLILKRIQLTVAILAGLATLAVGAYNLQRLWFPKPSPANVNPPVAASPIRSAMEEVGASWIKDFGKRPPAP